ncbi:MAG: cobalamin biosynthesis protein CbiX [Verrucomicrobiota bacterium]
MDQPASTPASGSAVCFLFDNGSLRPASTLALRALAANLAGRLPVPVEAVSLLHSSGVPPEQLAGRPARLLEPALADFFSREPAGRAVLLPLFFGPSAALTDYVPARVAALRERFPGARVVSAGWLVHPERADAPELTEILAGRVRAVVAARGLVRPRVVLVDHGTPQRGVTAVRDFLAGCLAEALAGEVAGVAAASMERRPGPDYAFNDPLLEHCLRTPPHEAGDVVVALQFLSPGRHAGPDGDVAQICRAAEAERPGLRTFMTETLSGDAGLVDVLARRYHEAVDCASA